MLGCKRVVVVDSSAVSYRAKRTTSRWGVSETIVLVRMGKKTLWMCMELSTFPTCHFILFHFKLESSRHADHIWPLDRLLYIVLVVKNKYIRQLSLWRVCLKLNCLLFFPQVKIQLQRSAVIIIRCPLNRCIILVISLSCFLQSRFLLSTLLYRINA